MRHTFVFSRLHTRCTRDCAACSTSERQEATRIPHTRHPRHAYGTHAEARRCTRITSEVAHEVHAMRTLRVHEARARRARSEHETAQDALKTQATQARCTHPRTRQHAIHAPGAHEVRTGYTVDAQRRRQQVAHHSRKWRTRASGTPVGTNVTHMRCARNTREMHLRSRPTSTGDVESRTYHARSTHDTC